MFSNDLFIDSQLAVSLNNNFDELFIPPVDTYPAQVRTDIKDYLNGIDEGIAIRRLNINKFTQLTIINTTDRLIAPYNYNNNYKTDFIF